VVVDSFKKTQFQWLLRSWRDEEEELNVL
jgi:hypothetical protein